MHTHRETPPPRLIHMAGLVLDVDYSTREAAELAGLPYVMIDRWDRAGVIASTVPAAGYGSRRRWSSGDVERICRIADVWREAKANGMLLTWQAVGVIWDRLVAGDDWHLTLVA